MDSRSYDLLVLGSGPAGEKGAAPTLAELYKYAAYDGLGALARRAGC